MSNLTCHVCITQAKIPSQFVRFSMFCPNLVSMVVRKVLPDDGWPPASTTASPEPSKLYELNFKILNFKSTTIVQNDLWFLYISRLNSLFASKAHEHWTLSLKNLTGIHLCLLFFVRTAPMAPGIDFSIYSNFWNANAMVFENFSRNI